MLTNIAMSGLRWQWHGSEHCQVTMPDSPPLIRFKNLALRFDLHSDARRLALASAGSCNTREYKVRHSGGSAHANGMLAFILGLIDSSSFCRSLQLSATLSRLAYPCLHGCRRIAYQRLVNLFRTHLIQFPQHGHPEVLAGTDLLPSGLIAVPHNAKTISSSGWPIIGTMSKKACALVFYCLRFDRTVEAHAAPRQRLDMGRRISRFACSSPSCCHSSRRSNGYHPNLPY